MARNWAWLQIVACCLTVTQCSRLHSYLASSHRNEYNNRVVDTSDARTAITRSPVNIANAVYTSFYQKIIMNPGVVNMDLTLLLDSSISLGEDNFENAKLFLSSLVGMMPIRDFTSRIQTSMYSFSVGEDLTSHFGFGDITYRELVRRYIDSTQYQNGSYTHMTSALLWINEFINRSSRRGSKHVLVIATDGRSNDDGVATGGLSTPMSRLADNDIEVFVVALGTDLDLTKISVLASKYGSDHIFYLRNRSTTISVLQRLARTVAQHGA